MVAATDLSTPQPDLVLAPSPTPESALSPATHASHSALFTLASTTIAITGGGRGLGLTLATAVLEAGGHAACLDILDTSDDLAQLQKQYPHRLTYRRVDITDETALAAALDEIAAAGRAAGAPFAGCVACAGIQQKTPAVDYPVDDFERMLRVNVTGTFLTAKHSARIMIREGTKGSIVMIASMSGQIANRVSCLEEERKSGLSPDF